MPHFFIKSSDIKNDILSVEDKELLKHLVSALRVRCGEDLKFIDENEIQYETCVIKADTKILQAKVLKSYPSKRKLPYSLCLVQSVLKPDAQSLLISNATQCGVDFIHPVMTDNCAVSKKNSVDKVQRWQKISDETSKQCERANFAKVCEVSDIKNVLLNVDRKNIIVLAEKYANCSLDEAIKDMDLNSKIYVLVGPEGGYSEQEFSYFKENNYKLLSLGDLIYKAPNAVVAGLCVINTRLK